MTLADFIQDILQPSHERPFVVEFWAPWCEPCKWVEPILHELAQENPHRWTLVKINLDEAPEVAEHYGIRSVPTTLVVQSGEVRGRYGGMMWKKQFGEWIDGAMKNGE
jgi:putative thioredoxin